MAKKSRISETEHTAESAGLAIDTMSRASAPAGCRKDLVADGEPEVAYKFGVALYQLGRALEMLERLSFEKGSRSEWQRTELLKGFAMAPDRDSDKSVAAPHGEEGVEQ